MRERERESKKKLEFFRFFEFIDKTNLFLVIFRLYEKVKFTKKGLPKLELKF